MKTNTLPVFLGVVFFCSALSTASYAAWYVWSVHDLRRNVQPKLDAIQVNRNTMRQLINDSLEYRKRNPAIDPILQSFSILPRAAQNKPANPSANPAKPAGTK